MRRPPQRHRKTSKASPTFLARQRQMRRRHTPVKPTLQKKELTENLVKLAEEGAQGVVEAAGAVVRSTYTRRFLKYCMVATALFFLVVLAGLSAAGIMIDDAMIRDGLIGLVEEQTGGKFEMDEATFQLLSGVRLRQLRFFSPLIGDTRGYRNGGEVESSEIFQAESLELNYQAMFLFLARVHLDQLVMAKPQLKLQEQDGVWNFQGILDYRAEHFPIIAEEITVEPENNEPLNLSTLLPIAPAKIFMPIGVHVGKLGIDDLSVELQKNNLETQTTEKINLQGLSFNVALNWFGRNSKLQINLLSAPSGVALQTEKYVKNNLIGQQRIQMMLSNQLSLTNTTLLQAKLANELVEAQLDDRILKNLRSNFELSLQATPYYELIQIETFDLSALDAILYKLSGDISLVNGDFSTIRLNLINQLDVDFFQLNELVQQFLGDDQLFGVAKIEQFRIQGDVKLAELSSEKMQIPYLNGNLKLIDVRAKLPSLGITLSPLNGHFSVGAGPSMIGSGSQMDLSMDLSAESFEFRNHQNKERQKLVANQISSNFVGRVHFPILAVPVLKWGLNSEEILLTKGNEEILNVPLALDLTADMRTALEKAGLRLRLELPSILDASASMRCRNECRDIKSNVNFDISSLEKIFGIVSPILQRSMALDKIPENLVGSVSGKFSAHAQLDHSPIEDQTIDPESDRLKTNLLMTMNDVGVNMPLMGVRLRGLSSRLFASGNFEEQNIKFSQDFDELILSKDMAATIGSDVQLKDYDFDVKIENKVKGAFKIEKILQRSVASLETNLRLGEVFAEKFFPRPVQNSSIKIKLTNDRLVEATLEKLRVDLPDFGAILSAEADVDLAGGFDPKALTADVNFNIDHGVGKILSSGVKTSGGMKVDVHLESENMQQLMVSGLAEFEEFSLNVPDLKQVEKPLLVLENVDGIVPMSQVIELNKPSPKNGFAKIKAATTEDHLSFEDVAEEFLEKSRDHIAEHSNRIVELDYANMRSFYPSKKSLRIGRVAVANLELSAIELDIEIRQNWFAINQLYVDFLGGKIQGDFRLVFDPNPIALKANLQLTRLDTKKLLQNFPKLKKKTRGFSLFSDPYLDASLNFKYDLLNSEMDGGLEITSIGKEQLKMILYYVDPEEQNSTISQIRYALNFGEVSAVSVPIKNGQVGLSVDLRLLSVPIPLPQIKGFPVAQVINNFMNQPESLIEAEQVQAADEISDEENEEASPEDTPLESPEEGLDREVEPPQEGAIEYAPIVH